MSHDTLDKPSADFGQFFRGATEDQLSLPRCRACARFHWYPMQRCPHCLGEELEWSPVPARGHVFSATTVNFAFTAATRGRTPYGVVLVALDVDPTIRVVCRSEATGGQVPPAAGSAVRISVVPDTNDPETGVVWCAPTED